MADVRISDLSLISAANLDGNDRLIVEQTSNGTGASKLSSIKEMLLGNSTITGLGGSTVTEAIYKLNGLVNTGAGAALHNSIGRGANLGSSLTTDQRNTINSGLFKDMFIGDFWQIGGRNYRIAAFDYYRRRPGANNAAVPHHVVLIPDTVMADNVAMHSSADNTSGYTGTTMHTSTLNGTGAGTIRGTIYSAFGNGAYVLSHTQALSSSAQSGVASGEGTVTGMATPSVDVVIPTAANITGKSHQTILSDPSYYSDDDDMQFPLFAFRPEFQVVSGKRYWLRDVLKSDSFAIMLPNGNVGRRQATNNTEVGVRPVFCIYAGS